MKTQRRHRLNLQLTAAGTTLSIDSQDHHFQHG